MPQNEKANRFNRLVGPHLDAGYNLARWLTGNSADAEDVMQEASMRAFRFLDSARDGGSRPWFFQIVRNTAYTWLRRRGEVKEWNDNEISDEKDPECSVIASCEFQILHDTIADLEPHHRELIVLREIEELSYEEIAAVLAVPTGTVMSRLNRARSDLKRRLVARLGERKSNHDHAKR